MWIAKFSFLSEKSVYGKLAKKYNLVLYGNTLSSYPEKEKIRCIAAGTIMGNENNKKKFISALKKESRVISIEKNDEFVIVLTEEKKSREVEIFYDKRIVLVKPLVLDSKGFEHWEVASWDKHVIQKMIDIARKNSYFKLFYFKQGKMSNVFVTSIALPLSECQKKALETAIKNKYYDFPRRISLKKLAKEMDVSLSTYREHLRKAEKRILGCIVKDIPHY